MEAVSADLIKNSKGEGGKCHSERERASTDVVMLTLYTVLVIMT